MLPWLLAAATTAHADDTTFLAFVAETAEEVAARRDLALKAPVAAIVDSEAALRARIEADFAEDLDPEELDAWHRALTLLGFCGPDLDLAATWRDVLVEQISGFYDPRTGQLHLVRRPEEDADPASDRLVVEHELVHALQDQHFGLGVLDDLDLGDGDVELALRALVEGDATFFGVLSLAGDLLDVADLPLGTGGAALEAAEGSALARAPDLLSRTLVFPYTDGAAFARDLYVAGGFSAVDAAYRRPPLSSEQILHPDRYLASPPDLPVALTLPDLATLLGPDWAPRMDDTLGELGMRSWLEAVGGQEVPAAPLGWAGDRYVVLSDGTTAALVWLAAFDDEEHATGFATRARATLSTTTGRARWRGVRLGRSALLQQAGRDVVIVIGLPPRPARRLAHAALTGTARRVRTGVDVFTPDPVPR